MAFRNATKSRFSLACWRAGRNLSNYVDGALAHADRREISIHLRDCPACEGRYQALAQARSLLKNLPAKTPPPHLSNALRDIARRESARRQFLATSPVTSAFASVRLRLENVMRPLAIPVAGGLVSALVLFSMLIPSYPVQKRIPHDVPTTFYTDPSLTNVPPFGFTQNEIVVELIIDDQGQVIDYSFPEDVVNASLRREIGNSLLFTRFTPAMAFGQPISGRIRLTFRRSAIDVKG